MMQELIIPETRVYTIMGLDNYIDCNIEELKKQIFCPEGCICCQIDLEHPDHMRYFHGACVNECLGDNRQCCHRIHLAGNVDFCHCEVRKYIAKRSGQ
jgi:hypothetical protein